MALDNDHTVSVLKCQIVRPYAASGPRDAENFDDSDRSVPGKQTREDPGTQGRQDRSPLEKKKSGASGHGYGPQSSQFSALGQGQ